MESLRCTNGSQGTSMGLPGDEPPWSVRIIPCTYTASRRIGSGIRRRQSPVVKGRRLVRRKGAGVLPCARASGGGMRRLETPHAVYTMRRRTPCIHAPPRYGWTLRAGASGLAGAATGDDCRAFAPCALGIPAASALHSVGWRLRHSIRTWYMKASPDLPRGITPRGLP